MTQVSWTFWLTLEMLLVVGFATGFIYGAAEEPIRYNRHYMDGESYLRNMGQEFVKVTPLRPVPRGNSGEDIMIFGVVYHEMGV